MLVIHRRRCHVGEKNQGKILCVDYFITSRKIKLPQEKGYGKGTVVFLKAYACPWIYFLAHLTSSPHSCDSSTISRSYVHQPGEPQHQGSPYVKMHIFFVRAENWSMQPAHTEKAFKIWPKKLFKCLQSAENKCSLHWLVCGKLLIPARKSRIPSLG